MIRLRRLTLLVFMLCLIAVGASAAGVQRALLVGCDRFVSQEDTVPSSFNNVQAIAEALASVDVDPNLIVTRSTGLSSVAELQQLIRRAFSGATRRDVSWFYISTHGLWHEGDPEGSFTMLLSDGVEEEGITATQLRLALDQIPGTKVLLIDACHSGAMLGKGTSNAFENVFVGADYKVLCSSGGAEDSWFWSSGSDWEQGSGYFSDAISRGIGAAGGHAADNNRDGDITLNELYSYVREHHGASVARAYPEHDGTALIHYDAAASVSDAAMTGISYDLGALDEEEPCVCFSYTLRRPVQVAYQLVPGFRDKWDFDHAQLIWDETEQGAGKPLSPGYKAREIVLDPEEIGDTGYVLLQLLLFEEGRLEIASSHVLCLPLMDGELTLSYTGGDSFCPEMRQEYSFAVGHTLPCVMNITVENEDGETVASVVSAEGTRPERLIPEGSSYTWDGRLDDGAVAPHGHYRIRVKATHGNQQVELVSPMLTVEEPAG